MYVVNISPQSAVRALVSEGDIILGVNDCLTNSARDLQNCLIAIDSQLSSNMSSTQGYHVTPQILEKSRGTECCKSDYEGPLQCFASEFSGRSQVSFYLYFSSPLLFIQTLENIFVSAKTMCLFS